MITRIEQRNMLPNTPAIEDQNTSENPTTLKIQKINLILLLDKIRNLYHHHLLYNIQVQFIN